MERQSRPVDTSQTHKYTHKNTTWLQVQSFAISNQSLGRFYCSESQLEPDRTPAAYILYNSRNYQYSPQIPPLRLSLDFQEPFGGNEGSRIQTHPCPAGFKVLNFREGGYVFRLDTMPHTAHSRHPCAPVRHPNLEVFSDPTVSILTPRDALPPRLGRRRKLEAVARALGGVLDPDLDGPRLAGHGHLVHDEQAIGRSRGGEAVP